MGSGFWRKQRLRALLLILFAAPPVACAQAAPVVEAETGGNGSLPARAALDAMVRALGGQAWLDVRLRMRQGSEATFFQGNPSGSMTVFRAYHAWPDKDCIEYGKRRDVVHDYLGRAGWEVTYKGKTALAQDQVDAFLRHRDHSLETVVRLWLHNPRTLLFYEGPHLAERHLAEQVTAVSSDSQTVSILIDSVTHLPLRVSYQWRDRIYKDQDTETEEYDDYHTIDGIETPLILTFYKNGTITRQEFLDHVEYNGKAPPDLWSVEAAMRRIQKKRK
ncbi:MAG: hypothetical protein ACP5FH_00950 [Terracidiphilus sp.]